MKLQRQTRGENFQLSVVLICITERPLLSDNHVQSMFYAVQNDADAVAVL